jgi:hypothetical protein
MIVQETMRVINYRMPFFRYPKSGCSFYDLHFSFRTGVSTARKIEKYVLVFDLSCFQKVFQNLRNGSGN